MLWNCSAVSFSDCCNSVTVCIISECRNFVIFCPCIKHWHSHTIIVRNNNIDLISERSFPCSDCVTCCSRIPCCPCWVLHFLRSKLTDCKFFSVYINLSILDNFCFSVYVCSCRLGSNFVTIFNSCSKCRTNTTCTCDRIIMSDITDCKYVSDNSITISVNLISICFDIINNHLSLKFCSLISIKSYIISIFVEIQRFFVQFPCWTIRRLTVKPAKRFVLIGYRTAVWRSWWFWITWRRSSAACQW